jgi:hypothetical protein
MSEVSGIGARRHFSVEEEEALRQDESTSSVVKRDAKVGVEIYGTDRSWRATKHHQQGFVHGVVGTMANGAEIGHAAFEGAEIAGAVHLENIAVLGAAGGILGAVGGPIAGLALGIYSLGEAHAKADEQARALAKDDAHVALIGVLDLPASYKAHRLDGEYEHVAKGNGSPAFKMAEAIRQDKKGLATLQLHADRGMNAARDLCRSGMTVAAFLAANPKVAESYRKDAAFREGFDAYLHAKANLPRDEVKELERKLDERDGWYAQSQISFRV